MADIEFQGTGGIIEGDLEDANVIVNLDSAYVFDGVDDNVNVGNHPEYANGTITFWARCDVHDSNHRRILEDRGPSGGSEYIQIYSNSSSDKMVWQLVDAGTSSNITSDNAIPLNVWQHYAFTWGSGGRKMYVNGVIQNESAGESGAVTNATATDSWDSGSTVLEIAGSAYGNAERWKGGIADVRVYNAALGVADIQLLASKINTDSSLGAGTTNLMGWWKLNNGSITDSGPTGGSYVTYNGDLESTAPTQDYDAYSVNVQDNSTTTDGNFTITQGKVEGKALTSLHFHDDNDYVDIGELGDYTAISMTAWVNPDDATPTSQGIVGFEGNQNGIATGSGSNVLRIKHESVNSSYTDTTYTWAQNKWQQVGFSWDGSTLNVFADGVKINSVSLSGSAWGTSNADIGALTNTTWNFDGQIRDVKLYDYGLSDDQMASLYSGSYNVTPKYWYKLDDCVVGTSITTAVSSGTATSVDGTLTNFENTDGDPLDGAGTGWSNGTLNLDGTLTIAANGTLSAPRGNMTLAGTTAAMDNSGTFTHNSGTVTLDNGADVSQQINDTGSVDPVFYNLTHHRAANSYHMYLEENTTVEGTFTNTAGFMNLRATKKLTLGTDTSQGTYTTGWSGGGIRPAGTSDTTVYIYGKNQLYPAIMAAGSGEPIDWNNEAPNTQVNIKWLDYQTAAVTGGSGTLVTLDGDCEFDAVTVSSGDTLDVDGQRVYSSGTVDINGNLKMGAGMWHAGGDFDTSNAAVTEEEGATFLLEGDNYIHNNDGSFAGDANTNILLQGTKSTYLNSFESGGYAHYVGNLIVGSGTATLPGPDRSGVLRGKANNITVATGATLTPSGAQEVICLGDFTTSGGLLGASCLDLEADNKEYVRVPVSASSNAHLKAPHTSGAMTVEAWVKCESDAAMEVWHKGADYVVEINPSGSSTSIKWADGSNYNFTNWGHNLDSGQLNVGQWHHIACARDVVGSNGRITYYLDGKAIGQVTNSSSSATWTSNDNDLYIGRYQDSDSGAGSSYFDGNIENLRIWNTTRTAAQIRESMFTAEYADGTSGLVEQWLFNEGTSHVVAGTNPTSAGTYANGAGEQYTSSEQANYTSIWAGAGTFTHGGTTKLKMTGTGTINYVDDALTLYDLEVTGATTLKGCDNTTADLRMNGNLTVSGSVASTASETIMILTDSSDKLFVPQALALDGTNDYVACGTSTDYDFTDHFTLAGWAKNDNSAVTSREHIIAKYAGSSGNRIFRLVANGDDMEFTVGYNSGADHITVSHSGINLSMWHHYAATFDGGVMKLYVDGALVTNTDHGPSGTDTLSAIHANNSRAVEIGSYGGGSGNYWQGNLADIRIYNAVLDATEVATLADNILPNQARTDNLISHWKLDTAAGTSSVAAANSGTGGNAGTVTNSVAAPWVGNRATALANLYKLRCRQSTTTLTIPELTTKRISGETNGSTIKLTGDVTVTEEIDLAGTEGSLHTLNVNGNTLSCAFLDVDGGTVDLRNSTYTGRTGGSYNRFDFLHGGTLLTGNTTITGTASPLTMFYFPAQYNYEIVGDVSNVRMRDSGDLTVIGSVTNFTLDDSTNNIRQWHHTLDTQQLLDADEAGDDDLRLTKPALDNALELMTK